MSSRNKIGVFIAQARERQGLTRESLAHTLHVSEEEIAAWEEGAAYPAMAQAPALARELSVSVDELFNARFHTISEEYQAPEERFLPQQEAQPDAAVEEAAVTEAPSPAGEEAQKAAAPTKEAQRLPRWMRRLFFLCLAVECAAGIPAAILSAPAAVAGLACAAFGAVVVVTVAAYCLRARQPLLRWRASLLPIPCTVLFGIFLCIRWLF